MDDQLVGLAVRRIRVRRGLRQADVARLAGVSRSTVSDLERGRLERVGLRRIRSIARAVEARIDLHLRWRGADVDRVLNGRHASMAEAIAALLMAAGWEIIPEFSFNHFGERGVVDIVAWHPAARMLLIVEIKTELADPHDLLAQMDRRRRVVPTLVRERGWNPRAVSSWVVVEDSRTNRRRLAQHVTLLRSALPVDGRTIGAWMRRPGDAVAALWFLPDSTVGGVGRNAAPRKRVVVRRSSVGGHDRPA